MTQLIKYEAACRALQEAKAVDEVKDLRDKADAMRIYGMQAKNKSLEIDAAEIRIRAERRLGELLAAQKESVGLNTGAMGIGKSAVPTGNRTPTLADVGIDKKLSARAQQIAAVPEAEFEAEVGEWRERVSAENERVTTRLQKAGEKAAKNESSVLEVAVSDEVIALRQELAQLKEHVADLEKMASETIEDNNSMAAVFEANDQVAAAMTEVKKHREMNRILEERVRGLQGECSAAKKAAVMWQRKFEKLEKSIAMGREAA